MPVSLIPSFLIYCYIGAITPGPANLCSLSAALRYGRGPALRQWRGLFVGYAIDSLAAVPVVYLLGTLLNDYVAYLSWVGAAYLLWMAWHMLRSAGSLVAEDDPAYPSFKTGVMVQVTNVKVIMYCLLAVGLFLPLTGPIANLVWLFAGASMQKLFSNHRKVVDVVMALSLALCAISLVWPQN